MTFGLHDLALSRFRDEKNLVPLHFIRTQATPERRTAIEVSTVTTETRTAISHGGLTLVRARKDRN